MRTSEFISTNLSDFSRMLMKYNLNCICIDFGLFQLLCNYFSCILLKFPSFLSFIFFFPVIKIEICKYSSVAQY
uniref:Uncharacterized protein n=1 Tax=Anguilla anguilla TaxID=7936 RepID=A0A0E9WYQ9_ANGAN